MKRLSFHEEHEIEHDRREERTTALCCRIFDFVANYYISREINIETQIACLNEAFARFRNFLPEGMIANLVKVQMAEELKRNRDAALAPKPIRKDIFGRPILLKKPVITSRGKP